MLNLIVLPVVLNGSSSVVVALESTLIIVLSGSSLLLLVVASIVEVVVLRSIVVEVVAVVLERHATVELLLDEVENLLNQLNSVRSLKKSGVNLVRSDLLSLIVEISSILSLSLLLSADLGQLVVGNIELLSIECGSVEVSTGIGGAIGLLEADEGASGGLPVVAGENLDALDLTEASEVLSQLLLSQLSGEVLHEEVALLLGVLESLLLSLDNYLSLDGSQSWLHIELASFNFLIVEFLDSSLS